mmetsp:Transcript_38807/g.84464  ORF Transcript_38807/g.84464 Transcript_38807/m.84464 type:complete len:278 (-) Transcript_38807:46-879(-)
MDLVVGHQKIGVPAGSPLDVGRLEEHVIGEDDLATSLNHLGGKGAAGIQGMLVLGASLDLGVHGIPLLVLVVNAGGLNLEPDDAGEISLDVLVVEDGETKVVVDEVLGGTTLLSGSLETDGEAHLVHLDGGTGLLPVLDHSGGQVVEDHVDAVLIIDLLLEGGGLILAEAVELAHNLAGLIETDLDLVQRVQDAIATQHLTEVLRGVNDGIGAAEGKGVILERECGLRGGDLVDLEVHKVIPGVILRRNTGQVEALYQRSSDEQARERAHGVSHFCV